MRFDLSDDQRAVRDAIDELCRARWDSAAMRRHLEGEDDGSGLWAELVAAGWTGAAIGERYGGQGLGTVELTLVSEGLGRAMIVSTADCRSEAVEGVDLTRRLSRVTASESDELGGDVVAAVDRIEVA